MIDNNSDTSGTSANKLSLKGVLTEILEKVIEPVSQPSSLSNWFRSEEGNAELAKTNQQKIGERNALISDAAGALETIVKKNKHMLEIPKDSPIGGDRHPLSTAIADEFLNEKNADTAKGRVAQAIRSKAPGRSDEAIKNGVGFFKGFIEQIDNALTRDAIDKIKSALAVEGAAKNLVKDGVNNGNPETQEEPGIYRQSAPMYSKKSSSSVPNRP